jgi:5,10-methylene-tetrahydrofolate dehydrogenase/methenyl tetrahydrofolate cyclohydrolase
VPDTQVELTRELVARPCIPAHIDEERVLGAIDYEKDVDGFHPLNTGQGRSRYSPQRLRRAL